MMTTTMLRNKWLYTLLFLLLMAGLARPALAAQPGLPANYYRIDDGSTDYISPVSAGADDADSGVGGVCTLRDALAAANGWITTPTTITTAEGCRVTLVGSAPVPLVYVINLPQGGYTYTLDGSELLIHPNAVHIVGDTSANTILQATADPINTPADYRVLAQTNSLSSLSLSGMTIRYGNCDATCNGTPANPGIGGGLLVGAPLTLNDVIVTENSAALGGGGMTLYGNGTITNAQITANATAGLGGGFYATNSLSMTASTISGNTAANIGGGMALYGMGGASITASTIEDNHALKGGGMMVTVSQGTATITETTIAGNTASDNGAGLMIHGPTTTIVTHSTISGNTAANHGGGIWLASNQIQLTLANSTVSGNTAGNGSGGGLLMGSGTNVSFTNVTMTGNTASNAAGGLHMDNGTLTMTNSLLVGNSAFAGSADADCSKLTPSAVVTTNHNVMGATTTCPTGADDILWAGAAEDVVDPVLADYGGATLTHALHPDSPAIDAGNQSVCSDPGGYIAGVDQRGEAHIDGDFDHLDACDIGAYEAYLPVALPGTASQADFAAVYIGASSTPASLSILNRGHVALEIGTVGVGGPDAGEFSLSNDLCSGAVIASGATCTFDVTFTSALPVGPKSASITLTSNGPAFIGIPLMGTAVEVAPDAPAPITPADGLYTSDTTPSFGWNSAANGDTYLIEIASDDEFLNMVKFVSNGSNLSYTASPALPTGTYYWRVTAFAPGGTPGPASEVRSLYVDDIPPTVPVLSAPADKAVITDRTPALVLLPVVGAVSYQFQIAVDAGFTTIDVDAAQPETTYTQPVDLSYGVYWWRARAIDAAGNPSAWSAPNLLTISTLLAPKDGSTTTLAKPAFSWAAISGATQYQLVVDDDANFASPVIDQTQGGTSFTPGIALANGLYYWHVQAIVGGTPVGWSPTWQVTVSASSAIPTVPVLVFPASGGFVNDNTPTLTWNAASSAVAYQVQIDTISTFPTPDQDVTGADLFFTPATLPDGQHYWRVRGVNAYGVVGSWTSARAFTVDTVIPATPVLNTPQHQAGTTDTTPTLTVLSVAGASKYRFQISNDNLFSTILIDATVGSTSYTVPSNLALTYYTYNWRVAAIDAAGNESPFSSGRTLFVAPMTSPGVTALITDTTPTFTWVSVPGASHYFLVLNDEPNFSNPMINHMTTGTSYTPAAPLPEDVYYWRVEPFVGADVILTPIRELTISVSRPAAPVPAQPSNGAYSKTPNVFLEIAGPVPGAVKYEYQVDDNSAFSSPLSAMMLTPDPANFSPGTNTVKYYWRVRAFNSLNAPGPWSTVFTFTIDTTAPATPAFGTPANGALTADTTPTLSLVSVTGAAKYHFEVAVYGTWTPVYATSVSGTSVTTPVLPYGRLAWRIAAEDAAGNKSPWSPYRALEITFLSAPANNAQVPTLTPAFSWLAVSGAAQYHLQVDNNANFSSPEVDVTQSATSYTVPAPLAAQTHYWRVEALVGGVSTGWTASRIVYLSDLKPAAPTLASPAAGFSTNDTTPLLSWNSVPGSVQYWIQIDNNSTFASPEVDASASAATSYTPAALPDGTYYWRVAAHSYGVFGAWSASRSIIVDTIPVAAPNLSAPANAASTPDRTPSLSVGSVSGAKQYQFQIADENTFAAPVVDQTVAATSFTVPNGQMLAYDVYYWRARTIDAAGNPSAWSSARALTITILSAPAANTSTTNLKPSFSWVSISGITQYQLVVDNTPDFSSPVIDKILGGTSFTPATALPTDVYYWRVMPLGTGLPWMPYRKLTITPPPPGAPVLKLPATGAVTNDTTPYFKWAPAASGQPSASYGIQIDNSSTFASPERNVKGLVNPHYTSSQLAPGVYYWRVRAYNSLGVPGAWSSARSFTLDVTPPAVPVITAPADNAVLLNGTPTLSVAAVSGTARYRFQIGKDANFAVIAVDVNSLSASYTVATWQALQPGTYYLRVQTIDAAGNASAWSTVRTFTR